VIKPHDRIPFAGSTNTNGGLMRETTLSVNPDSGRRQPDPHTKRKNPAITAGFVNCNA